MALPWPKDLPLQSFPTPNADLTCQVCVVGGGLCGVATALLLQQAGKSVILIERNRLGSGVTGYSTGHLTSLLDPGYYQLISNFSADKAERLFNATTWVRRWLSEVLEGDKDAVDWQELPAYYYSEDSKQSERLEQERQALESLGVQLSKVNKPRMPFAIEDYQGLEKQLQVNPLSLVNMLAEQFIARGGKIYENTAARDIQVKDDLVHIDLPAFQLQAEQVVQATHTPLKIHPIQMELRCFNSYVIAGPDRSELSQGLFYDMEEPYHYIRRFRLHGEPHLMIGGADSVTGAHGSEQVHLGALRNYAREKFGLEETLHWSSMFFKSSDGLPFIGRDPLEKRSFLATGFGGDGLTYSLIAAQLNCGLIMHGEHPWEDLFSPSRIKLANLDSLLKNVKHSVQHLVIDRIRLDGVEIQDLKPGQGKVLQIDGKKVGVYVDEEGGIHPVNPVCSHLGCLVEWNNVARSWDCGCHGSRFDMDGRVISGPATLSLFESTPQKREQ